MKVKKIGEILVTQGSIKQEQLDEALEEQKSSGKTLGSILVKKGFVTEDELHVGLSEQLRIPYIHLQHHNLKQDVVRLLPEQFSRKYQAIVIDNLGGSLLVGVCDPTNLTVRDQLNKLLKKRLRFALVKESDLLRWINQGYRKLEEINTIAVELNQELGGEAPQKQQEQTEENETPVMKILEAIFKDALAHNASDIHIEPDDNLIRIRQRVDGVLFEHTMNEISIAPALILRLKLLAELNISEKRLPQDGRFHIKIMGKGIDVRLSTMPIEHGESAVMRLIESSDGVKELDRIGMPEDILKRLKFCISRPHGVILVTGPTGSGKTTSLYGCLNELNDQETKIITCEDPVEFSLARICQVQINAKIDLTFARVLRACLRQDPDVIMVGEIRDGETASIALRASITGHLVLSTLHTNDAVSTVTRLIDMGIEPFLVASAVQAIVAQRLIRKLCDSCKVEYSPTEEEMTLLKVINPDFDFSTVQFNGPKGCPECNQIGFKGRIGVYELLQLSGEAASALRNNDTEEYTKIAKTSPGYVPLVLDALRHALAGNSTVSEVIRLAGEIEEN